MRTQALKGQYILKFVSIVIMSNKVRQKYTRSENYVINRIQIILILLAVFLAPFKKY